MKTIRTWPTDPDQDSMPDVGDVLMTAKQGRLYLVHSARPTRGHPPEARRLTLLVVPITDVEVPASADVFTLTYGRR